MSDINVFKKYCKRKIFIGFMSLIILIIFIIFGDFIFEYYKSETPQGSYSHTQDMKFLFCCVISVFIFFIPYAISFFKVVLDLIFKKKKTIIVTGQKKPKAPWDMREDYVLFYAKGSSKLPHKFVVFKDVYSLKGKKVNNTYEVTYYIFSKVVTDMKKCKKDSRNLD